MEESVLKRSREEIKRRNDKGLWLQGSEREEAGRDS